MHLVKYLAAAVTAAILLWLFGFGGIVDLRIWANAGQEEAQRALAGGLRAVRAGEPGAWLALMGLCGAYGFFHAAGPGHGKLVIGGYGMAAKVTARRLSLLALISSLAQALAAVLLVTLGAWVLGWGRAQMTHTADGLLAPASYIAIALVGVWLMVRGGLKLMPRRAALVVQGHGHGHGHDDHHHGHHHDHSSCGHAHGPTPDEVANITSWRDAVGIVGAIAIRPCTGAVFLLILCFGLGIPWAGVAGAFVMGLGTASVTVLVALAAVSTRASLMTGWDGQGAARAMAVIEMIAGLTIALVATALVLPLL